MRRVRNVAELARFRQNQPDEMASRRFPALLLPGSAPRWLSPSTPHHGRLEALRALGTIA
jgi:hypothetical protein